MAGIARLPARRLGRSTVRCVVAYWRRRLGIGRAVRVERINRRQVVDARGRPGCGLVGVVFDADAAVIYHTRPLTPEDVVHELLHVAHPGWSEAAVVEETERLLGVVQWRPGWDRVPVPLGRARLGG